ncbi:hypothetical protein LBMAG53_22220 [Planctomycetota bacterium]|nr:hypothetical protein LBMAG53_22220 [Planctomycetota bacterium]
MYRNGIYCLHFNAEKVKNQPYRRGSRIACQAPLTATALAHRLVLVVGEWWLRLPGSRERGALEPSCFNSGLRFLPADWRGSGKVFPQIG